MRRFVGVVIASVAVLGGCADVDEEEAVASDDSAIAYGDANAVQLYNANLKHMSEPGRPSFEGTDFTELLSFMRKQGTLPDILTLQEVGTKTGRFTSQSCDAFLDRMERIVRPSGWRTTWRCIVAAGSTSGLGNAPGGVAIVHRARFQAKAEKRTVALYRWSNGVCRREDAGSGWTALVQRLEDGKRSIAVASVHLPTAGEGTNATGDDCSGKNLALVEDALAATKADVKVIAGDMNHGDATRHLDAKGNVVHDWWEVTYRSHNAALSDSRYQDAFFDACKGNSACLESEHWTMNAAGALDSRIDWMLVAGARSLEGAKTIGYSEVSPRIRYSDHRAQMLRVRY